LAELASLHGFAAHLNQQKHWFGGIRRKREAQIISRMVADVRSGKATYETLLSQATAISELRLVDSGLDRQLKQQAQTEENDG
jgi:uncharacterized glyoxalase superfamily metalloenzyme YdcJ